MSIPWTPHAGQRKGVKYLLEHAAAALLADPGVGKTSIVYGAYKILKKRKLANKMLVIAPLKPAYLVWGQEASKWTDFEHLRVEILHGPKKDEALHREADVYVINPDGLDWLLNATRTTNLRGKVAVEVDVRAFKKLGFDTLVVDELTQFKHTNSGRFKTLKAVLDTFGRRWGLTGTPAPNGLIDLFGQCYILDQGRSLGPYVTHYRQKYFLPSYDGFGWVVRKGAEEEIYERLRPLALRLAAEDYIDMPQLVETVTRFDLPAAVQKIYNQLEDVMITEIDNHTVVASNAAAASTKLRQIVNGGVYVDDDYILPKSVKKAKTRADGREWAKLHDEKTDLLENLVEELQGSPLLVAYDFHHDLARLQERFGKDVPFIGGGTTPARSLELEAAWNRGELPLLLGHPQSIGHGLNLQRAANHVAWYANTWNRELFDQFNGRVHRQGNKSSRVFLHLFLARGTVDEVMYWALRGKAKVQNALLAALKEMRAKRK